MVLVLIIIAAGCVRIKSHDTDAYDEERYGESDNRATTENLCRDPEAGTDGYVHELEFSTRRSTPIFLKCARHPSDYRRRSGGRSKYKALHLYIL